MAKGLDLKNWFQRHAEAQGNQDANDTPAQQQEFLTILPGEIPESLTGGDYIKDNSTDIAATPGAFERNGMRFRPVNPMEYAQLTKITADPTLNRTHGARRLSFYLNAGAPQQPQGPQQVPPQQQQAPQQPPPQQQPQQPPQGQQGQQQQPRGQRQNQPRGQQQGPQQQPQDQQQGPRNLYEKELNDARSQIRGRLNESGLDKDTVEALRDRVYHAKTEADFEELHQRITDARERMREANKQEAQRNQEKEMLAREEKAEKELQDKREEEIKNRPGVAEIPEEGPVWAGHYFDGMPQSENSWRQFDTSRYADVNVLSIEEIRQNFGQLFGELMTAVDPRMAEETIQRTRDELPQTRDQERFIEYVQFELSALLKRFDTVAEKFDAPLVERLSATRPELRAIVMKRGAAYAADAFKAEMLHTMVRNRKRADKFFEDFKKLTEREATARGQKLEQNILNMCKRFNIPRVNYELLVVQGNKQATREKMEKYISERSTKFEKWLGLPEAKARWRAWRAVDRIAPIESNVLRPRSWVTSDIDQARRDIGDFLALSVSGDEFRSRLEHSALLGEDLPPSEERSGPLTAAEARAKANEFMPEVGDPSREAQQIFNRQLALYAKSLDKASALELTPVERRDFRDNIWIPPPEMHEQVAGRPLSLFGLFGRALLRLFFNKRKANFKIGDNDIQ